MTPSTWLMSFGLKPDPISVMHGAEVGLERAQVGGGVVAREVADAARDERRRSAVAMPIAMPWSPSSSTGVIVPDGAEVDEPQVAVRADEHVPGMRVGVVQPVAAGSDAGTSAAVGGRAPRAARRTRRPRRRRRWCSPGTSSMTSTVLAHSVEKTPGTWMSEPSRFFANRRPAFASSR